MIVKVKYQNVRVAVINQDDGVEELSFSMMHTPSKRKIQNAASVVLKEQGHDPSNGFVIRSVEQVVEKRSIDIDVLLENSEHVEG